MKKIACTKMQVCDWIKEGKKFVCFGMGRKFQRMLGTIPIANSIRLLTDNNSALWGEHFHVDGREIPIVNPKEASLEEGDIVLITTAYHRQVKDQMAGLGNWEIDNIYYIPSPADENFYITNKFIDCPLENKIVFRSARAKFVDGMDYHDNTRALFEYLIANGFNKKYKMVWYVHDPKQFSRLQGIENVEVVSYEWEKSLKYVEYFTYFYHLYTAKYLFASETFFFMRYCREGQVRINLWHGCGFKNRKVWTAGPTGKYYDFYTVTGSLYQNVLPPVVGCEREQLIDTGLAKQDWLFQPMMESLSDLLPISKASKYVFWLPTFRMTEGIKNMDETYLKSKTGFPIVTSDEMAEELNQFLDELDMSLIVKLHPAQNRKCVSHWKLNRILVIDHQEIVKRDLIINRLLARADALISDYSSVAVDYMLLDRPLAFAIDDVREYQESRGFLFDPLQDYLPGMELYNFEDFKKFLQEISEGIDSSKEKREKLMKIMHSHHDGNNCKRILEAVGIA